MVALAAVRPRRDVLPVESRGRTAWLSASLVTACLLGVIALVAWPWLRADTQWLETGDGPNHLLRIYVIDAALRQGAWYPRWLADLYLGYGYPLLNFYAPAMYYVAAGFGSLGMTVYASLVWTGAVGLALGVTGTFALARAAYPGRRDAALLAAAAYALAPYPFFANLYGRAAIPEALALGLLPWFLRAGLGAWHGSRPWAAALSLAVAALPLTHNISALLALGLLIVWLAALPWLEADPLAGGSVSERTPARRGWARVGVAVAAGLALSAFFWLPALAETRYVQIERAQAGPDGLRDWLFTWPDLLRGLSRATEPGVVGPTAGMGALLAQAALGKSAPERVSLAQALLWLLAFTAPILTRRVSRPALFWCALAAACWLLNGAVAMWLWVHVPLLAFVQFPWRLYGPLSLAVAMAAAGALVSLRRPQALFAGRAIALGTLAAVAASSFVAKPYHPGPLPSHDVDGRDLVADETNHYAGGSTTGGEFLPKTVRFAVYTRGHERGIMLYDDARDEAGWQAGLVRVLEGRGTVTGVWQAPNWIAAQVQGETGTTIAFHQLLFPGWRAYLDGQPTALQPVPYFEPLQAWFGYMVVAVPPGEHRVEVRLGPTAARLAGDALSAATAAMLLVWWGWRLAAHRPASLLVLIAVASLAATTTLLAETRAAAPVRDVPLSTSRLALDITGAVAGQHAETGTPSGNGTGLLPPFLDLRYRDVAGDVRRWLYMHPPSRVSARLRVPPHAYFQAGLALDPQTWQTDVGDGVRFILEADGPNGHAVLMDRRINPRARVDERRWVDVWVSLAALAGQDVTLTMRTDPVEDLNYDWAGWANPQIVIWNSARPDPGSPHPY